MLRGCRIAAAAMMVSAALAGCSGSSRPSWTMFEPAPPPAQALQFESKPPGADVRTAQGQTCRTPCTLAVPLVSQSVTFELNGYMPQTMLVEVRPSTQRSVVDNSLPPEFSPNPVTVELQTVPPSKPAAKPKPPKTAAAISTTKPVVPHSTPRSSPTQDNVFPPPPPTQPSGSPFPPPPR